MVRLRSRLIAPALVLGSAFAILPLPGGAAVDSPLALAADGGLSLNAALAALESANPTVRAARLAQQAARAELARVDVKPNPTVQAQVSNTEARRYPYAATDRLVRVEQLFERGSKRELRAATAQAGEQAAGFDLADALRRQRVELTSAYLELAAAQRLADLAAENLLGYERLLEATQKRVAAGDLAPVDATRLRVEAERAANEERAAQAARAQAQLGVAVLLGAEAQAARLRATDGLDGRDALDTLATQARDTLDRGLDSAIARRPDLRAAERRVIAATQARALAASLRTRDVTLGVQADRAPSFGGTVFGVSATIPLFVNNDFSGEIARAQADVDAAQAAFERTRAAALAEALRAHAQLQSAAQRGLRLLDQTLPAAQRVADALEIAYQQGAASLTDLFDARRQRTAVQAEAIRAQADFGQAHAAWRAAIDGETGATPPGKP
ncbi:MAG: TolC family protein [Betaproteobacteria bacterium]|nr:TolC family protein [Betaproteobacteria bacterium]